MHPNSPRRVYSAEFKSQVLADCRQSGVSVAAVALAHGLNVNLVRKWLVRRGLKRCGVSAGPGNSTGTEAVSGPAVAPALQFVPVHWVRGRPRTSAWSRSRWRDIHSRPSTSENC